jgi:hypothetical protein
MIMEKVCTRKPAQLFSIVEESVAEVHTMFAIVKGGFAA